MNTKEVRQKIESGEYKLADSGVAKVMDSKGNVDVDYAEKVKFSEYEDKTEEKIIAIEEWEDGTEYSTGYYLDADEIQYVSGNSNQYGNQQQQHNFSYNSTSNRKPVNRTKYLFLIILFISGLSFIGNFWMKGANNLKKAISKDNRFTYVTSVTSDLDNDEKADVYESCLDIQDTVKAIIGLTKGEVEDVDESAEDGTVAIITKGYYCLIYTSQDSKTLVQISTRKYVYTSRNEPYRAYDNTSRYYRAYYYSKAYYNDYNRYKGSNAFEGYSEGDIQVNDNNNYKEYAETVRQESVATRTSSGGGTSSGK